MISYLEDDDVKRPSSSSQRKLIGVYLSKQERCLISQAKWYIYSSGHKPKSSFDDPYFQKMLKSCNFGDGEVSILSSRKVIDFARSEHQVVLTAMELLLTMKLNQAKGNQFLQVLHDGSTAGNGHKYQAIGFQLIEPNWKANLVVCIAFERVE